MLEAAAPYPEKLANKILATAPNLSVFLLRSGMEPANNAAERANRHAAANHMAR